MEEKRKNFISIEMKKKKKMHSGFKSRLETQILRKASRKKTIIVC